MTSYTFLRALLAMAVPWRAPRVPRPAQLATCLFWTGSNVIHSALIVPDDGDPVVCSSVEEAYARLVENDVCLGTTATEAEAL